MKLSNKKSAFHLFLGGGRFGCTSVMDALSVALSLRLRALR